MNAKTRFEVKQKTVHNAPQLLKGMVNSLPANNHPRYEGHEIPTTEQGRQGNFVTLGLDFKNAPTPTRKYAADTCDVIERKGDLLLIFGQESVFQFELDSVLQIRLNKVAAEGFLNLLDSPWNSATQQENWSEMLLNLNLQKEELTPVSNKPPQQAKIVANYAGVAISGTDTCIDFYYSSAFAMQQFSQTKKMFAEPMVRVDLHTALFVSFVDKMRLLLAK